MWSIEVSEDASEEEVIQAVLDELDFDYIRECIAKLSVVIQLHGPLAEVEERTEGSDTTSFTKTFHETRGWICDELESVDPSKVWTLKSDPVNGYSYLSNGYEFTGPTQTQGIVEIKTWYVAERSFVLNALKDMGVEIERDRLFTIDTEFIISQTITEDEDRNDQPYYVIDVWELVGCEDWSDEEILTYLDGPYWF
jgi:hypothetical protein